MLRLFIEDFALCVRVFVCNKFCMHEEELLHQNALYGAAAVQGNAQTPSAGAHFVVAIKPKERTNERTKRVIFSICLLLFYCRL